jgi:homoserine dehydrogenase
MAEPLKVGLAGLGTVGTAVIRLLERERDKLAMRCGRPIDVVAVTARSRKKNRDIDIRKIRWAANPSTLAADPAIDVFVEVIGGDRDPAKGAVETALAAGKPVVTANKALLARHGQKLAALAERCKVALNFEAAVGGAIPVVKTLREGLNGNSFARVYGILNGTCNYILSAMEATGRDFGDVLAEAQELGFAEADPTFDIEGVDAGHKLAILAAIAFGARIDFAAVEAHGISRIRAADIEQAEALGYVIRLIGMADTETAADGSLALFQRVQPHLVPRDPPLAHVDVGARGERGHVVLPGISR